MVLPNLDWSFTYSIAQSNFSYADAHLFVLIIFLIIAIAIYIFASYCFYAIFKKLGEPNAWFAWVPFLSHWAFYKAGNQSPLWTIGIYAPELTNWLTNYQVSDPFSSPSVSLLLSTIISFIRLFYFVALVFSVIAMVNILKKLGKNPWLTLVLLIPLVNFIVLHNLAFG